MEPDAHDPAWGKWQVRHAGAAGETPFSGHTLALVPRDRSDGIVLLPAYRIPLSELEKRIADLPPQTRIAAVAADDDALPVLAQRAQRVISLVIAGALHDVSRLSPFTRLRALRLRLEDGIRLYPIRLPSVEHLEIELEYPTDVEELLKNLGIAPDVLRGLVIAGDFPPDALDFISSFRRLELLSLAPAGPAKLDPARLSGLCALRELTIASGAGLFPGIWRVSAALPRLRVLSVRSLAREVAALEPLPENLRALHISARLGPADVETLSKARFLEALHLQAVSGAPGEPALPALPLDIAPLAALPLRILHLQGDFQLPPSMPSVHTLRFVAGPAVPSADLEKWTSLTHLHIESHALRTLRLPRGAALRSLFLADFADSPLELDAAALQAALSPQTRRLQISLPGLAGTLKLPENIEEFAWAGAPDPRILPELARTRLVRLELYGLLADAPALLAFFRLPPPRLRRLRISGTAAAPEETWEWAGEPGSIPPPPMHP